MTSDDVPSLLRRHVRVTPTATALRWSTGRLDYAGLDAAASAVARRLLAVGVGPEHVVGLLLDRSPQLVVAELATWKAGGAYLPFDPGVPERRLLAAVADTGMAALVTDALSAARLEGRLDIPVVVVTDLAPGPPIEADPLPDQLAYVIHTSGSTGRPKSVAVSHRSAANFVRTQQQELGVTAADRLALLGPPGFDASVSETWLPLVAGGECVLPDPDTRRSLSALRDWLVAEEITACILVTPIAEEMLRLDWPASTRLRLVLTGGDRLTAGPPPGLPFRLVNGYGPTETTVLCTIGEVDPGAAGTPDIGRPFGGATVRLLDDGLRPADPGEIHVAGPGLARGYLAAPALTAERFVPDPDGPPGSRMYRSGDLARWRPDGRLDFIGRLDGQVKIRGNRVELGEVESVLGGHPAVRSVAVVSHRGASLVAFVVTDADTGALDGYLRERLPGYAVPRLVPCESLPLTQNGKIDRTALAAATSRTDTTPPRTATERTVAATWSRVLDIDELGVHEDFFARGGQSLLAMRAMLELERELGRAVPTRVLFDHPTVADFAAWFEGHRSDLRVVSPVVDRRASDRLSPAQHRLWYFDRLVPNSSLYNGPLAIAIDGPVDAAAVERALNEIVRRHEPLRTRFIERDGEPAQVIDEWLPITVEVAEPAAVAEFARRPFDLTTGPLMRALLVHNGPNRHELVLNIHHIAFDGWSTGILLAELAAGYAGETLPALRASYADVTGWPGRDTEEQLAFWLRALDRGPEPLELPTDRPRPAERGYRGARLFQPIEPELTTALAAVGARSRASLFMVMFAAFQVLMHRLTGRDDIVTAVPVAGRTHPDSLPLIGFFTNTLPLRTDLGGAPTFAGLLDRVRADVLAAFANGDAPLERIVEGLRLDRDPAHNPLCQVMFVMQPPTPSVTAGDVTFALARELDNGGSKFDLTISMDGPTLSAEYAADLFDPPTIERLLANFEVLLAGIAADPGRPIWQLPLLTERERRLVRTFSVGESVPRSADVGLHSLFERQAAATPTAVAVEFGGDRLSYAELDRRANRLANRLRAAGAGPDVPVALSVPRSLDLPVAVLGILKAGSGFVALDPTYPSARLEAVLAQVGAPILVADSSVCDALPPAPGKVILVDRERADIAGWPDTAPSTGVRADNLAYVVYTSGSTGEPKGIAMTHGPIVNLVCWQRDTGGLGRPLRTLQFATLGFDICYQELFTTWAAGGTLVMIRDEVRVDPDRLLSFLHDNDIERLFLPFVMLQALAGARGPVPARLREIITGGERLRITPQIAEFVARLADCVLHNQYGPSETHASTSHLLRGDPADWPELPVIGRPIANSTTWILDPHGQPTPIGVPGEIHHGGDCLSRCYYGRPDLTAERYLPDPTAAGKRRYRTGDRARFRPDGTIEFVGRTDFQVKIRGFRVEPAEIEAVLSTHPTVHEVAVAAVESARAADRRLVAYLTCTGTPATAADYRAHVAELVPDYMVPSAFVVLDALPLTPSGKLDRRALPAPEAGDLPSTGYRAPRTALEHVVAAVFCLVLRVDEAGIDDDFYTLGGHSLIATRLVAALRDALGVDVELRTLLANPTVAGLAAAVLAAHGPEVDTAAQEFLTAMGGVA